MRMLNAQDIYQVIKQSNHLKNGTLEILKNQIYQINLSI